MENYKPNSFKHKEEQERIAQEKVVSGKVVLKKKSGLRKITDAFVNEDMPKVKNYILSDVLIPSLKKAISDIVRNGIDMVLYGETDRNKKRPPGSRVSYRSYYDSPGSDRERDRDSRYSSNYRATYDYDNAFFEERGDAESVLASMEERIHRYGQVTVADLYDFLGVSCDHSAENYGWMDLRSARVTRVSDGYLLKLPRAYPID